ncbi:MAG: type II CAAX endopeptidase family protein [Verrucomicrobia bacterium]|nr:type II CAAX endopeptidase family protein [Verrucomicrobiota bacterium]
MIETPHELTESKPEIRHSRLGLVIACAAIIGCVGYILYANGSSDEDKDSKIRPNRVFEMASRYAVGLKAFTQMGGTWNVALMEPILQDLKKMSPHQEDALRREILKGWLTDQWPSELQLTATVGTEASLLQDVATLGQMKSAPLPATDERWVKLQKRHGWMAELARAQTLPKEDADRRIVMQQAMRTTVVMVMFGLLGFIAAVGGLVLFVLAILRWRDGSLKFTMPPITRPHGGLLMEGFAVYMTLFLILPSASRYLFADMPRLFHYGLAFVALGAGFIWPLWRGMQRAEWRMALGLHRGQGMLREMGAGVLGWLACLPLLVLGMIAASLITKLTGATPTHPIMDDFSGSLGVKIGAVLLAAVWAPISEEIMFRGFLFPGLSAWLRWFLGMLVGAFIFAVIHPQGWAGVPAIMALASAFSLLRMWRESLIAPMTAHALNNGLLCALMLSM